MGTNCNICSNKCYGIDGYHGSCCSIEDRNYIIGPHHDTEEFIKNLSEKLGREVEEDEVTILVNGAQRGDTISLEEARLEFNAAQTKMNQVAAGDRQAQIQATAALKRARARFQAAGGMV